VRGGDLPAVQARPTAHSPPTRPGPAQPARLAAIIAASRASTRSRPAGRSPSEPSRSLAKGQGKLAVTRYTLTHAWVTHLRSRARSDGRGNLFAALRANTQTGSKPPPGRLQPPPGRPGSLSPNTRPPAEPEHIRGSRMAKTSDACLPAAVPPACAPRPPTPPTTGGHLQPPASPGPGCQRARPARIPAGRRPPRARAVTDRPPRARRQLSRPTACAGHRSPARSPVPSAARSPKMRLPKQGSVSGEASGSLTTR